MLGKFSTDGLYPQPFMLVYVHGLLKFYLVLYHYDLLYMHFFWANKIHLSHVILNYSWNHFDSYKIFHFMIIAWFTMTVSVDLHHFKFLVITNNIIHILLNKLFYYFVIPSSD
jgi:hypothetical protein